MAKKSMMKTFAIACADFYEYDLKVEIIKDTDWRSALLRHTFLTRAENKWYLTEWKDNIPNEIKEVKRYFLDADSVVDIVEVI